MGSMGEVGGVRVGKMGVSFFFFFFFLTLRFGCFSV